MKLNIVRPKDIPQDKLDELRQYLVLKWREAKRSRSEQVDSKYPDWEKAYSGVPLETVRTVPFHKSSNFVVKLIRMYLDTFVARSLNVIYATKPIYICDGLPREIKESTELYLNNKALYDWKHYALTREMCFRGNKNGTVAIKTPWLERMAKVVTTDGVKMTTEDFIEVSRPNSHCVPFEDFYVYPITAQYLCQAEIIFNKVRYSEEETRRLIDAGTWTVKEGDDAETFLKRPSDNKRDEQQSDAGITDTYYKEAAPVECYLKWSFNDDANDTYSIMALIHPETEQLLDLQYNAYPDNMSIFADYRPLMREDLYYGESLCNLLGQSQEEASVIHNDRRNNSFIANAVCFKRRNGSQIPNPSTNWYPGKVFDVEDLDDLQVFQVGRNYDDMLQQENYTFQLAEKLSGISDVMQGNVSGQMGKHGIYNTSGTMAMMSEGNQRQDTNMKDVREALAEVGRQSLRLQCFLGGDDPFLNSLSDEVRAQVGEAFKFINGPKGRHLRLEVKTSSAGVNKEVERANLIQMASVVTQFGQGTLQMATQLANPGLNATLRLIMNDQVKMMKWVATRILRQFDEFDAAELLPDIAAAIEATVPGGSRGTSPEGDGRSQGGLDNGGLEGALPAVSRFQLGALSQMSTLPGGGQPQ